METGSDPCDGDRIGGVVTELWSKVGSWAVVSSWCTDSVGCGVHAAWYGDDDVGVSVAMASCFGGMAESRA